MINAVTLYTPAQDRDVVSVALAEAEAAIGDPVRAKHIAFEALLVAYPGWSPVRLGFQLNYRVPREARADVNRFKTTRWWNDYIVDCVVGALVADQYGDRAN